MLRSAFSAAAQEYNAKGLPPAIDRQQAPGKQERKASLYHWYR
jgi:hypothetical protein